MIRALTFTILIEGIFVLVFCNYSNKSARTLLPASLIINVFTQLFLWITLGIFFRIYMAALLSGEALIWFIEGVLMHRLSKGGLDLGSSLALSLCMNAASFGLGWFLPI